MAYFLMAKTGIYNIIIPAMKEICAENSEIIDKSMLSMLFIPL
jgi:hypothetical protein